MGVFVVLLVASVGDDLAVGHRGAVDNGLIVVIDLIFVWLVVRHGRRAVVGVMVVIAVSTVAEAVAGRWIAVANGVLQIASLVPVANAKSISGRRSGA